MIITWLLDLPFTSFMVLWTAGLPFLSLAWYCFFKTRKNELQIRSIKEEDTSQKGKK